MVGVGRQMRHIATWQLSQVTSAFFVTDASSSFVASHLSHLNS